MVFLFIHNIEHAKCLDNFCNIDFVGTGPTNCHHHETVYEGHLNVTFNGFNCIKWTLLIGKLKEWERKTERKREREIEGEKDISHIMLKISY